MENQELPSEEIQEQVEGQETEIQEVEQTSEEPTEKKVEKETTKSENSPLWEKRYKDLEKDHGRLAKEVGEFRRWRQEQEIQSLNYQKQQQMAQIQEQHPNLPLEVVQKLVNEQLQQQLAPIQAERMQVQATSTIQEIQKLFNDVGKQDQYDNHADVMANYLDYFQQNQPEVSNWLSNNPWALLRLAAGEVALGDWMGNKQQSQQVSQARQSSANRMSGTLKPNKISNNATPNNFDNMSQSDIMKWLQSKGAVKNASELPNNF
jgi:hypothetical protein